MAGEFRILGLPEFIQSWLGISVGLSEMFTVLIIFCFLLIPAYLLRTRFYSLGVLGIFLVTSLTAIGWLPFYAWVLIGLFLSYELATKIKRWF